MKMLSILYNSCLKRRTFLSSIASVQNIFLHNSSIRHKYAQHNGVKGIRSRKSQLQRYNQEADENEEERSLSEKDNILEDPEYDLLAGTAMNVTRDAVAEQSVFIIQPYVKWGPKKNSITPDLQLQEAEALIRSLPQWRIASTMKVPLETLERKTVFGKGKLAEIKTILSDLRRKGQKISCLFISKGTLSFPQKKFLEEEFNAVVMDRYSIVIQILRLHAISSEAKIQVAMAEIPYIWGQMKDSNVSLSNKTGYYINDTQKDMLKKREKKLKQELEDIRNRRRLLRKMRKQKDYPVVAVVGYTNAGKTSLIKALTEKQNLHPRDQLFATLDVTAHAGVLPCNLQVIYMDTVGFMADIPTGLLECFIATLEDAMLADVIVHVQDLAHANHTEQKLHVENTLKSLINTALVEDDHPVIPPIINVGNKIDLLKKSPAIDDLELVSSKTLAGMNSLMLQIESRILQVTGRSKMTFRVCSGGEEMSWLYKNAAVTLVKADPKDEQNLLIEVVITSRKLQQFKNLFIGC